MKNIIQGWFFTILGIALMVVASLDFAGFIEVPAPEGLTEKTQIGVGFLVGLCLFILPPTWIEEKLKAFISKKVEKE